MTAMNISRVKWVMVFVIYLQSDGTQSHRRRRWGADLPPPPPQKKFRENIFGQKSYKIPAFCQFFLGVHHVKFGNFVNLLGKCHVKFGHFVNLSCIYFPAKMSCPPKLTELLCLCSV